MVNSKEAEELAGKFMVDYLDACDCKTTQDVANVLMKLASMCGLGMCATVGQKEAVERLEGTAHYIAKTQEGINWKKELAH